MVVATVAVGERIQEVSGNDVPDTQQNVLIIVGEYQRMIALFQI